MVANRIESKKGILQVAIACADLGLTFVLVGAISDMGYMQAIMAIYVLRPESISIIFFIMFL